MQRLLAKCTLDTVVSAILAIGLLLPLAGCGGSGMVKVTGTVLLDGAPVESAAVMFMPTSGRPAEGFTDAQGNFSLQTTDPNDGAEPGEYKVTVVKTRTAGVSVNEDGTSGTIDPAGVRQEWIVPQKYSMPDTSGLTVTVAAGMAPVKLELTSK